jgi:hypothetical protein
MLVPENPFLILLSVNAFFNDSDTHCVKVSLEAGTFKFLDI